MINSIFFKLNLFSPWEDLHPLIIGLKESIDKFYYRIQHYSASGDYFIWRSKLNIINWTDDSETKIINTSVTTLKEAKEIILNVIKGKLVVI